MPNRPLLIDPLEPRRLLDGSILFIRGADRSGGFIEATSDAERTEQLADIRNGSTAARNHGWKTLADTLRDAGYDVSQVIEPLEADAPSTGQTQGAPLRLDRLRLSRYDVVVFGSNNARYAKRQVDAVQNYVRDGGAALFISDGNFGSDWRDSPDSDKPFLNRFGIGVNQDEGTYSLTRADDFLRDAHPIFAGVTQIDGEGVSPLTVTSGSPATRLIGARGQTRSNASRSASPPYLGQLEPTGDVHATLSVALAGEGRVAGHFDRNTFFNANGAGTDLTRFDNRQYALNLFAWLTDDEPPGVAGRSFEAASGAIKLTFNESLGGSLTRGDLKLRNRLTGAVVGRDQLRVRIVEDDAVASVTVTPRTPLPAGAYRLEIRAGGIADAAGNVRRSAIRFNFDVPATAAPASLVSQPAAPSKKRDAWEALAIT